MAGPRIPKCRFSTFAANDQPKNIKRRRISCNETVTLQTDDTVNLNAVPLPDEQTAQTPPMIEEAVGQLNDDTPHTYDDSDVFSNPSFYFENGKIYTHF